MAVLSATAVATLLGSIPVSAADGEVYDLATRTVKYTLSDLMSLRNQLDAGLHSSQYGYEYNGNVYALDDVNEIYSANPEGDLDSILSQVEDTVTPAFEAGETTTVKVDSVSAINATTVRVELETAPTTDLTTGDFTVKVDGVAVAVSAVTKTPNTTKSYDLTIATLANKEGSLEVNGKAATIDGSDFGYDFEAPTVSSVTAVDNKHVLFTFSEKVDKVALEGALVTDLFDVEKVNDSVTDYVPTLAKVQADGKSVLVTLNTAMINFNSGYIATAKVNAGLKDIKGQQLSAETKIIFDGSGATATTGPVALGAVYTPSTSSKIVVKFDKDISATIDKSKITVGGAALALADTVSRTGTAELTITLSSSSKTAYDTAASKDVVFAEGAVKDTELTPNNMAATTITPVSAAKLTAAIYDEASNKLTLTFDKAINIATIDLTAITLNGEPLVGSTSTVNILTQTANSATLEFTLSDATDLINVEGAAKASRALVLGAGLGAGFAKDVNGNTVADATYTSVLNYTDDVTAPVISGVTYNATTNKLVITANEDVTVGDITKLAVYEGTTELFKLNAATVTFEDGSPDVLANTDASVDKKYVLTLSGGALTSIEASAVNKSNLALNISKAGTGATEAGFVDIAGNKIATDADVSIAIAYTDQDAVTMTGATQSGVAANQVKLTFNKSLAAADLVTSKFTVAKKDNAAVTVPVTAVASYDDNKTVILTIDKDSANYVNGYEYAVSTTAKDIYGNPYQAPADITGPDTDIDNDFTLDTTVTGTAYALTGVSYADTNSDYTANAGDKITLTFNGAVSLSGDVTVEDFELSAGNLGSNFTVAQGSSPEKLVITLGTGASFDLGTDTLDITGDATKKHIVGANGVKVDAAGGGITIAKPDAVKPYITKAVYNDANGSGALNAGDTLTLTFSEAVNIDAEDIQAATAAPDNDLILSAGSLVLDGTQVSSDGNTVTIGIKTVTTPIVPGTTTIKGDGDGTNNNAIFDKWGLNFDATASAVIIEKSDTTAPAFSNVKIVKGDGNTGSVLQEGDKVVFDVSEAIQKETGINLEALTLYAGDTAIKYATDNSGLGFGGDGSGGVTGNVMIDNSAKTVTITIAADDGWVGADVNSISSFNIKTLGNATFTDANGNEIQTASGFGLSVTK